MPWKGLSEKLVRDYRGRAWIGRAPHDPAVLFKMLSVAYICCPLSVRAGGTGDSEVQLTSEVPSALQAGDSGSHHSTLTAFGEPLLEIVNIASDLGLQFSALQVIERVNAAANLNTEKDDKRWNYAKPPRDTGARWGSETQLTDQEWRRQRQET
jgi:hypothetical protein